MFTVKLVSDETTSIVACRNVTIESYQYPVKIRLETTDNPMVLVEHELRDERAFFHTAYVMNEAGSTVEVARALSPINCEPKVA